MFEDKRKRKKRSKSGRGGRAKEKKRGTRKLKNNCSEKRGRYKKNEE